MRTSVPSARIVRGTPRPTSAASCGAGNIPPTVTACCQAVAATRDELVTYGGQPITVMYHAISGGRTEAAQTVFSQALPYLVSVESDGEEGVPGYRQDTLFTFDEMAALLGDAFGTWI